MANHLRGDIQGLRAVAVLIVIAGHAGVPFVPGGFIGVDVFFVISGYLIAGLLYREVLVSGGFSLGAFWARRARRILPAATLVTVVTVFASIAWMSILDSRQVVIDALWASGFAANIHFAQQGVYYFAQDTGPSPLQHYWSLAVEEQFYVVWPLLLLACIGITKLLSRGRAHPAVERLPRRAVVTMLVTVSLLSLVWSILQTVGSPATAYFSTFTRAWELGVGALMALVPPSAVRRLTDRGVHAMALLGAGLLIAACVLISEETPFPGVAAALPVMATAMLLLAGTGRVQTVPGRLLATTPMRHIGDWSYSLYLWHWPALILPAYAFQRALTPSERLLAVFVVFTLSAYSYRFVEMPFRQGRPAHRLRRRRALLLYPVSASLVVATAAASWMWTDSRVGEHGHNPPITVAAGELDGSLGDNTLALVRASVNAARDKRAVPSDLSPDLLDLRNSIADVGSCDYEDNVRALCPRGNEDGARTLVLIGDSHARAWIPAFNKIIEAGDWRAFYLVKPQCTAAHVTIASTESDQPFTDCSDFQDWVMQQVIVLHPDLVVVASSPPVNGVFDGDDRLESIEGIAPILRQGYDELFLELSASAEQVALLRDVPKSPHDPATCLTTGSPDLGDCIFEPEERSQLLGDVAVVSAKSSGAKIVDPTPWLCYDGECPIVIGGKISYRDTDHLTTQYAEGLWEELGTALRMIPTS
jgi:peptidoglycan/LPS O-acetylase OafA/YrhL